MDSFDDNCAQIGGVIVDNFCYVLLPYPVIGPSHYAWQEAQDSCDAKTILTILSIPGLINLGSKKLFDFGRLAIFPDYATYAAVTGSVTAVQHTAWVGAEAMTGGKVLSDYYWMTDKNTCAGRVTTNNNTVNLDPPGVKKGPPSPPFGLLVNVPTPPYIFYGDDPNQDHSAICQLGKYPIKVSCNQQDVVSYSNVL